MLREGGIVSLGKLGEGVAEFGVEAAVRDLLDMLSPGQVLLWMGSSMVNQLLIVVIIDLMMG